MKTPITNISAVGIIYRASNPSQIFIEVKDDGHPIKLVRRQLCPIGGNWIGEAAKEDSNTFATFQRELNEELSFDRPIRNAEELALMGMAEAATFAPTPLSGVEITTQNIQDLNQLKETIRRSAVGFGDFLNTVPKSAMDAVDPTNKRDSFTTLASYYTVGLGENDWHRLHMLQKKFGNLSNESITTVTSLDEIIRTKTRTAFGHDRVLQIFWRLAGFEDAKRLPLVPGLMSEIMGMPFYSYDEYLEQYDVAKKPV